ncbi:uncharacterized protein At4g26485-like [Silene latifolia]|uniref:uncharacterized protein At4g26485-like n=1 Tax=Silene latifolia TaxID=37657 RepID=UPI003D779F13
MGQVFSYIWKWFRPKQEGERPESRKTHHGYQEDDQLSHYITIPEIETQYVSSSNSSNVNDDNPQAQSSIMVDLSAVQPKVAKKKGKKQVQVSDKNVVLVKKEMINKVCNDVSSKDTSIKRIGPYTSKHKILLVGEGDFSFSACLAVAFGSNASNIIATSLNSQEFLIENYGKFLNNKMEVENRGGMIIHGINARTMVNDLALGILKFDRIIFNFPHCGKFGRTDADMRANKELIRGFLRNAKKMINEDGEIHITHKSNGYFLQWDIPKIGSDQGLRLIQEVKFKPSKYPGYNTKFGFGGDKNFDCTPSKTYKFGLYLE